MTQILFDGIEVPYEPSAKQSTGFTTEWIHFFQYHHPLFRRRKWWFSLSVANMDSKAILPVPTINRKTIKLGFTQNIKNLTVSGNLNYSKEDRINPPNIAEQDFSPVVIYTLATSMPLDLLEQYAFDENGDEFPYSRFTNRTNPYFALSRFENNVRDRVYGNITARYEFTDWLYLQGKVWSGFLLPGFGRYNLPHRFTKAIITTLLVL